MSTFLTGKELEEKLTDIIWNAKKHVVIISPFIKLDNYVKDIFEKIKVTHEVHILLVFGKNEGYKLKSFNKNDFDYFKEFKNISILYNKDLHAKHYSNEKEALITSLNLYDYSMINNIEYGVHFTKNINPADKLFEEAENFTYNLVFEKSEVVFIKKPQYKKKYLGLSKVYQNSKVLFDISDKFFNEKKYEIKHLNEFEFSTLEDVDELYNKKPQREDNFKVKDKNKNSTEWGNEFEKNKKEGYCIRTGEKIPYNPDRPMSYSAWKTWSKYEDYDFPENYCHKTGKKSNGKTSMRNPILK